MQKRISTFSKIAPIIVGMLLSGCGEVVDLAVKQNKSLFSYNAKHNGLTLQQLVNKHSGYCVAAVETKFVPNNMESADDILLRIEEYKTLAEHAKFGKINGKFVEYNGLSRAYGSSCLAGIIDKPHILSTAYCNEVSGPCINLIDNNTDLIKLGTDTLYNLLAETRYRSELTKSPETTETLTVRIENTCSNFGYKKGSEKFADCMKDLYLKETGGSGTASASSSSASGADSATAAQIEALRQQTEAMRKQAEAAERARQSEALINLGTSIMNQGQPSISCTTMGNRTDCY